MSLPFSPMFADRIACRQPTRFVEGLNPFDSSVGKGLDNGIISFADQCPMRRRASAIGRFQLVQFFFQQGQHDGNPVYRLPGGIKVLIS